MYTLLTPAGWTTHSGLVLAIDFDEDTSCLTYHGGTEAEIKGQAHVRFHHLLFNHYVLVALNVVMPVQLEFGNMVLFFPPWYQKQSTCVAPNFHYQTRLSFVLIKTFLVSKIDPIIVYLERPS